MRYLLVILFFLFSSCIYDFRDCNGVKGGGAFIDSCGVCVGGDTGLLENYLMDECGVCDGFGAIFQCGCFNIPDIECDCDGNTLDCNDRCGGTAFIDDCGVCVGGNTNLSENYLMDDCGVCGGDGPEENYDCDGNCIGDLDCEGVCAGSAILDECGICNGSGFDCGGSCDNENIELWNFCYNIESTTIIDKSNWGLSGEIPPEIGNLINLQELKLSYNSLYGEIPPEIGNLVNLRFLTLGDNHLTGEIPSELGNLSNLQWLYLFDNQFTGEIPVEIGNLTYLNVLNLCCNQLSGEIPIEIGNLTYINEDYGLKLNDNQLSGQVPDEICNQGDPSPDVGNNQLCPTNPFDLQSYPSCISQEDIDSQDTSNCQY